MLYLTSGQDSCNGDSGGPMVYRRYVDDPWYQAGIASFGYGHECGTDAPGIYTRIGGYMDWIDRKLEE